MNRFIFSISFCAVVFIFSTVEAFGCTCMHLSRPIENEFKGRDAIFSGKVIRTVKTSQNNRQVTIRVENSWKGKVSKTVTISTSAFSSMCGYTFAKGKRYLIYAYGERNDLSTNICSRTKLLSDAEEDIEILNNLSAKEDSKIKSSPK